MLVGTQASRKCRMGLTLTEKILVSHKVYGHFARGEEIAIKIDQCFTQDSLGTMAWLQFESLHLPRVRCETVVSYVDHTTLAFHGENTDDHFFLQSMARRFGAYHSKAGNGICHQVHREQFAVPGQTLLGSDSHTPTAGAVGMLAFGVGCTDVAAAMAGGPYWLRVPRIFRVFLEGTLAWGVFAKDIALELIRRLSVKGAMGAVLEFDGPALASLNVDERATLANMGCETGAISCIFPCDEMTRAYFTLQNREQPSLLAADPDAEYDREICLNLSTLEPLVAMPGSPDNVVPVSQVEGYDVHQVYLGSCTNGSYTDLVRGAALLEGAHVHDRLECILSPGSRQVELALLQNGAYAAYVDAGFRMVEPGCHACVGVGFVPGHSHVSVRSMNRNWFGRSGSKEAFVILSSVETAVATALAGHLADPRKLPHRRLTLPEKETLHSENTLLIAPLPEADALHVEIYRAPNIVSLRPQTPPPERLRGEVLLKTGHGISTDDILPSGSFASTLRSNLPALASYVFHNLDRSFARRAFEKGGGFVVGGEHFGMGVVREHTVLALWHLGIRAILAKSFDRAFRALLVNNGIWPLVANTAVLDFGDELEMDMHSPNPMEFVVYNLTKDCPIAISVDFSTKDLEMMRQGGRLAYIRKMVS